MRIALISPFPDITVFGLRTMSAYLRERGHWTRMIFLPDPACDEDYGEERYRPETLRQLVALCRDVDLVGITLMTNYFAAARQITHAIHAATSVPVVWGGVHATICPDECIVHADIVCVGDGEEALLDLADALGRGAAIDALANLWVRAGDGAISRNPPRPLLRDLDRYPAPDYSLADHHFMVADGTITPFTRELTERHLRTGTVSNLLGKMGYQTMTGRGCPHKCSYCANDALKNLYDKRGYLRWRSVEHVIDELEQVKHRFPDIGFVWISDDAFFSRPSASLAAFCTAYKERIGLPFSCLASPLTVTEEKMALLVDAGLVYVQMGIESGSARMQALYNRARMDNRRVLRAARIINRYRARMFPPSYDFLLDVPYERTEDTLESLRLIARLPKPYRLQPFSLVLYPGTELHRMGVRDGHVRDAHRDVYAKSYNMRAGSYPNLLFALAQGGRMPGPLLRLLASRPLGRVLAAAPLRPGFAWLYRALRALKARLRPVGGRAA
ncbi:cobalamin-binding protein [Marichromatium purpuratum 984]|uniref:Cobalamin-binding protein n=1 Tax=Marichromatium purpuratum 984 TaxID=765910 RepID=W0E2D1_MARPU|nr:radical SAM protein [Marichromatium purpuratum]AHF04907.1 cobalamin-binding protein [Marichromatium purpuratum 984]